MPVTRIAAACRAFEMVHKIKRWEIAADLGVSPAFLSHWAVGREMPSMVRRKQMATYFGLESGDDLLGFADPEFLSVVYQASRDLA